MWIIIAVIVVFLFVRALNNAGKRGGNAWREEDDWAQLDEDLD
jgi:large-conductance mechanosensitive channel